MARSATQKDVLDRIDAASRRALFAQERGDLQAILAMYDAAEADLVSMIRSAYDSLATATEEGDERRVDYLQWKIQREQQFAAQVRARMTRLRTEIADRLAAAIEAQVRTQAEWMSYGIDQATPPNVTVNLRALAPEIVEAMVNARWEGAMFSQRLWVMTDDLAAEVQTVIANDVVLGKGIDEIVRDLRSLVVGRSNAQPRYVLERLVRTEVLKGADRARERVFADNRDLVEGEDVVATLDARTDDGCEELDGLRLDGSEAQSVISSYEFDARPPFHPNCRCTTIPALKKWGDLLGLGDAPADLEDFGKGYRAIRGPDGKTVLAPVQTFDEWRATVNLPATGALVAARASVRRAA